MITATLSRVPNDAGESALGDVIADAQLAATRSEANGGAVAAFTNPGGIRTDIVKKADGAASFADIFASQPFRNQLVTLTLTGAEIKTMLEQQWLDPKRPRILQVSKGFSYAWDSSKAFRRARHRRAHDAERRAHRGSHKLPRHRQQLSRARRRRLYGAESREPRSSSASSTTRPCSPISRPTARSRRRG